MPFELPTTEEKPAYVRTMFDRIASSYDRVNDLMTAGRHRAWKRTMVRLVGARSGGSYLDLCTGTGDIARLLAQAAGSKGRVVGLDFSEGMLEQARLRAWNGPAIEWLQGDAQDLPFESGTFDAVTVGFGLRNVKDLDRALAEIRRVLKPGGHFVSLDLGKPRMRLLRWGSDLFSYRIVPALGSAVTGQREAYEYLPHSNQKFPDQRDLALRLKNAGFERSEVRDRFLGAIALVSAQLGTS